MTQIMVGLRLPMHNNREAKPMPSYTIRLEPECDLEDFLDGLTRALWDSLVMMNQVGDPHHYPFLEDHIREFIKPHLVLCDWQGCWKPYVRQFERRSASHELRPVGPEGLAAYLDIHGTQDEFTRALVEWLGPRIRSILYDQNEMERDLQVAREALLRALEGSTKEVTIGSQVVSEGTA